jgi:hypothetical protein
MRWIIYTDVKNYTEMDFIYITGDYLIGYNKPKLNIDQRIMRRETSFLQIFGEGINSISYTID